MTTAISYNHETVTLDGEYFDGCEFRDCRMVYAGGKAPVFKDCQFVACDWRMEDHAAETLSTLRAMWASGAKARVQELIKEITGAVK
jgi:hypothetical protein